MGRPRKYESDAARKAAQRKRDKARWVEVDRDAHEAHRARLDALQRAVSDAAQRGDAVAQECKSASVETMLDKLVAHFSQRL